jgi:hypothetical protein
MKVDCVWWPELVSLVLFFFPSMKFAISLSYLPKQGSKNKKNEYLYENQIENHIERSNMYNL